MGSCRRSRESSQGRERQDCLVGFDDHRSELAVSSTVLSGADVLSVRLRNSCKRVTTSLRSFEAPISCCSLFKLDRLRSSKERSSLLSIPPNQGNRHHLSAPISRSLGTIPSYISPLRICPRRIIRSVRRQAWWTRTDLFRDSWRPPHIYKSIRLVLDREETELFDIKSVLLRSLHATATDCVSDASW